MKNWVICKTCDQIIDPDMSFEEHDKSHRERSKREDSVLEEASAEFRQFLDKTFDRRMEIVEQLQRERDAVL